MKKIVFGVIGLLTVLVLGLSFYIFAAPDLPEDTEAIIEKAVSMDLPEYYAGQEGYATNDDVQLWYEKMTTSVEKKGTVLLVMGYASTSLMWPQYFFQDFLDEGYDVIRYDHRDIGKSTWLTSYDEDDPYTLEDFAADAKAILDKEEVSEAHIVGISMGGMIAQTFAIQYPETTASLTSMSSTAYFDDESLPGIWPETQRAIGRYTLRYAMSDDVTTTYKYRLTAKALFTGKNYDPDFLMDVLKARYELEERRGINPEAAQRHEAAIVASGSRYDALKQLDEPTLIIHGRSDPLVNFAHGEKTAGLIPNAKTLYIEDLGHDIPRQFSGQMTDAILSLIEETQPDSLVQQ